MLKLVDSLATRLIGLPVQIRLGLDPRILLGRVKRAHILVRGARAGGLLLEEVDIRVSGLALVPAWPPRVRVGHVEARVFLEQKALDSWSKGVGLPVRLRLRPGRVVARTGIAGLRLSEADMDVQLEDRTLRLVPRRINVLGMEATSSRLGRIALPLPKLPRDARLVSLDPEESALRACLAVDNLDEELTRERLQAVRRMASKVMHANAHAHAKDAPSEDLDPEELGTRTVPRPNATSVGTRSVSTRSVGAGSGDLRARTGRDRRPRSGIIEATVLDVNEVERRIDPDNLPRERPE